MSVALTIPRTIMFTLNITVAVLALAAPKPFVPPFCRPSSDQSRVGLPSVKQFLVSPNPTIRQHREDWGVAQVDTLDVALVSDEQTCRLAFEALLGMRVRPARIDSAVFVYKLGSAGYAVDPGLEVRSEYRGAYVFNTKWQFQGSIALPNVAKRP